MDRPHSCMQLKWPFSSKSYITSEPCPSVYLPFTYIYYKIKVLSFIWAYKPQSILLYPVYPQTMRTWSSQRDEILHALLHATTHVPFWVLLELPNCVPIPMVDLLWLPHKLWPPSLSPIMLISLRVRDLVHYSGNLVSPFLPLLPLFNNLFFPPGF